MQLLIFPLSSFGLLTYVVVKCCDILEECTASIFRVTISSFGWSSNNSGGCVGFVGWFEFRPVIVMKCRHRG